MTQFLQATLYGVLQGGLLALVAVGFSLVWGVMNVDEAHVDQRRAAVGLESLATYAAQMRDWD